MGRHHDNYPKNIIIVLVSPTSSAIRSAPAPISDPIKGLMCVHPKCHRPGGRMQDQSLAKPRRRRPQAKLSETDVLIMWAAGQNYGRWFSRNRSRRNAFSKRPDGRMDLGIFLRNRAGILSPMRCAAGKKIGNVFPKKITDPKSPQATRRRTNRKGPSSNPPQNEP